MKNFFKSLSYLKPYRKRLALSITFVIMIAGLYGGGLAMLLPGIKILISPEGFHGWAWNSIVSEKLDAKVSERKMTIKLKKGLGYNPDSEFKAVDLLAIRSGSPLNKVLKETTDEMIVGIYQKDTDKLAELSLGSVAKYIATSERRDLKLKLYNREKNTFRNVQIEANNPGLSMGLLQHIVEKIPEPKQYSGRFDLLVWLLIIAGILTILRNVLRFFQEYLVQTAIYLGLCDLRRDCYNVALRLPVEYYAEKGTTDTMSRFITDVDQLAKSQITLFGKTMVEPAKAIATLVVAIWLSPTLTFWAMVGGPFIYLLIRKLGKRMKRASKRELESRSDMLGILEETLTGIRVVKAYTMESAERKKFYRTNRVLYAQQRKMSAISSAISPSIEALGMIAGGFAAAGAAKLMFTGQMDDGTFIAWMASLAAMYDPARKLSKVATTFHRGEAAAQRVFELRELEQEKRIPGAKMLPLHEKSVEIKNVTYQYPNAKDNAVDGVTLNIKHGQSIAIVGPNGCGKTTLLSLIPRLLVPKTGEICIDGIDTASHSLRSLRGQIGVVTQETVIFNATIAENIAYGLRNPSREDIIEAAKKAHVDEFVSSLPEGYDTMVGQRGSTLSGGQRQRIAIARAILRNPSILIFDEALSQIDPHSEKLITDAMGDFIKGRTTFMIAHRFQTILESDIIVVMDKGKIDAQGTHAELLESCELYQHLYNTQFNNS